MTLLTIPKTFLTLIGVSPPEWFEGNLRKFYHLYRIFTIGFYFTFVGCLVLELISLSSAGQATDRVNGDFALVAVISLQVVKVLIYKKNQIPHMCSSVEVIEKQVRLLDDPEIQKLYKRFLKQSYYISGAVIFATSCTSFWLIVVSCSELWKIGTKNWDFREKAFMYDIYFPVDKNSHFTWIIIVDIYAAILSTCLNVSCNTVLYSLIIFGTFQLKRLQIQLRKFHSYARDVDVLLTVKQLIQDHQDVIRYIENLNDSTKYATLLDFLFSSLNLASVLFQVITVSSLIELAFPLTFCALLAMEIVIIGLISNEIKLQGLRIADAIHESPWYEQSETVKKLLYLMILRSQKPLTLTIGPFSPLTTETIISITKASYSYVALMRSSYEK